MHHLRLSFFGIVNCLGSFIYTVFLFNFGRAALSFSIGLFGSLFYTFDLSFEIFHSSLVFSLLGGGLLLLLHKIDFVLLNLLLQFINFNSVFFQLLLKLLGMTIFDYSNFRILICYGGFQIVDLVFLVINLFESLIALCFYYH